MYEVESAFDELGKANIRINVDNQSILARLTEVEAIELLDVISAKALELQDDTALHEWILTLILNPAL